MPEFDPGKWLLSTRGCVKTPDDAMIWHCFGGAIARLKARHPNPIRQMLVAAPARADTPITREA
jgi:hypothetical protein